MKAIIHQGEGLAGAYGYRPVIDRVFDLADGLAALEYRASAQQFGKVVLRIP